MKKILLPFLLILLMIGLPVFAKTYTAAEAKQFWLGAGQARTVAEGKYAQAKQIYEEEKNTETEQGFIDAGKNLLFAVLDEAEAWLNWKKAEATEITTVPETIREDIIADTDKNLAKIVVLRNDVRGIDSQVKGAVVFLKMIGNYLELLTDVARNNGAMWVHIGNQLLDRAKSYEIRLRRVAEDRGAGEDVLAMLDSASAELALAKSNVSQANSAYGQVVLPGTPLIKFAEGNSHLRQARLHLLGAQAHLASAFQQLLTEHAYEE